jgi:hypothetical protein
MSEKTKNKIFWLVFIFFILGSIVFTFVKIFINLDYKLVAEVSCNPETESCFIYTPEELCEGEGSECLLNIQAKYYKIIYKKALNIPVCNIDISDGGCPEFVCEQGESDRECYYEYNEQEI